jgi:hypothetical protein
MNVGVKRIKKHLGKEFEKIVGWICTLNLYIKKNLKL